MSYVCNIKHNGMHNNKKEQFKNDQQNVAEICKVLSHPARVAIIELLTERNEIKTGDISETLPIGRTTVSRHLKELKDAGIINGSIDGLKIHYCLNMEKLTEMRSILNDFLGKSISTYKCNC